MLFFFFFFCFTWFTLNFHKYTSIQTPDEALVFGYKTFSSVYNKHAPFMTKRVKYTKKPPWLSKQIDEASKRQATESKETRRIQKAEEQSDIFNTCFKKHTFKI